MVATHRQSLGEKAQVDRILQISTRDRRGGAERIAQTLAQAYQVRGYQSWLVVGKQYGRAPNVQELRHARSVDSLWSRLLLTQIESLRPLRRRGVRGVTALQARLRFLAQPKAWYRRHQGYEDFDYPGTWNLFEQLPGRPDIIHCHNLHGDYFDLRALPWLSRQRPVILHLHDTWHLSGHCAYSLGCERWQTGCGQCPHLDTYPAIARDKSAENWRRKQAIYAKSHLYIVTVSQWLLAQVQSSMLANSKNKVIHNGIDLNQFYPADQQAARHALNLPPQARIVLYTAHSAFKDSATMKAALERLVGKELLFVCIGQGGREEKLGQGRLIRRGYIKGTEQVAQYYRAADIYLHAATADAFPTTILEALACGTPVVATAVGGIPEQIKAGQTGYLVPPKSAEALSGALQALLDDESLRKQMGHAAADHAKQYFSLDRQVDEFLAWYDEVLADWQESNRA